MVTFLWLVLTVAGVASGLGIYFFAGMWIGLWIAASSAVFGSLRVRQSGRAVTRKPRR